MRNTISSIAAAALLIAGTGAAQAARTTEATAADGGAVHAINNKDVLICRYIAPAGSHLTQAVCHTALMWKHMHDYSREYLEDIHNNAGLQMGRTQ